VSRAAVSLGIAIGLALACQIADGMASATINGDGSFRLLKLDGHLVKWGDAALGSGATVRYAFVDEEMYFDGAHNCRQLVPIDDLAIRHGISLATLQEEAAAAFRVWEAAANITFIAVDDPDRADILIGAQGQPAGRAYANVEYQPGSTDGVRTIGRALVCRLQRGVPRPPARRFSGRSIAVWREHQGPDRRQFFRVAKRFVGRPVSASVTKKRQGLIVPAA
jgi:hypothetical protein